MGDLPAAEAGQIDHGQHRLDPRGDLRCRQPPHAQAEGDVVEDVLMRKESEILEHHAEVAGVGRHAGQAAADGGTVFDTVPGLGETLARRIAEMLDIRTLEELEQAAHDGRLGKVEGFGPERVRAVQTALVGMLSSTAQRRARQRTSEESDAADAEPPVALLLDVDAEYRRKAAAGDLDTIAPKRFNPEGKAWLPILRTRHGVWTFTALFSNTARAHEAGKTNDWVVIYFERQGQGEEQRTVICLLYTSRCV